MTSADVSFRKVGVGCFGSLSGTCSSFGGHDVVLRIAELPPELVADDNDVQRGSGLRRVLHSEDDPGRAEKEHNDKEDRDDGPGELDLRTAKYLWRF